MNANYTWSKSIDDASDPGGTSFEANLPQDVRNLDAERALSSFDHRHRLVSSFVYEFPGEKKNSSWAKRLLAGWQMSGIISVQTGAPFTSTSALTRPISEPGQRSGQIFCATPIWIAAKVLSDGLTFPLSLCLPPFTFGNAGRNIVFAPGYSDVDFSLQKETRVAESVRLKFRAEAFNLFNHPNFDVPNRIAFTPGFGRIFSAEASRQVQLGIKLEF